MMKLETLHRNLEKKFPKAWFRLEEDHIRTGEGSYANDGNEMFRYWSQDHQEKIYIMGVHKSIHNYLEKNGWFAEWHDAGTIDIWPI